MYLYLKFLSIRILIYYSNSLVIMPINIVPYKEVELQNFNLN
jgi:hypothetical protein